MSVIRRLLGGQGRRAVEPARHARLAAAVGARAEPAQGGEVVERRVAVGPVDRERRGGPVGVDLQRATVGEPPAARSRRRSQVRCGLRLRANRWNPARWSPGHHRTRRDHRPGATRPGRGYPRPVSLLIDDLAQDVRPRRRPRRAVVRGAGRPDLRVPRGERRGQDDDDADRASASSAANGGRVIWNGTDTRELPRATWGYLPEERGLYPRMVVLDQLVFFAVAPRRAPRHRPARRPGVAPPPPRHRPRASARPRSSARATSRRSS